jgi:UDP-N-acetylglucosamine--N-acetylmuramyl-(pentapeptide) pyrophosphoryl-undecaprenol N-acetylglucosamine transferase
MEGRLASRKVYFAVFGSGLGHVTRILEIAKLLPPDDFRLRYSSSGQGYSFLRAKGLGAFSVNCPPLDVEWASGGGFSSHRVLPGFPFMFNNFLKQVAFERRAIRDSGPTLVVSDSRLSALLAAWSMGYPVITMLNQFKVLFPPRFRGRMGRFYERVAGDVLGLMWSLSERVLVTDLPPPFTIGEENLAGSEVSNIVEFVGFTAPMVEMSPERVRRVKENLGLDNRPLVFCQISGPDATKGRFAETLLKSAELTRNYNFVISMGYSGGSPNPRKLSNGGWLFDWCPIKDELFELSAVIVARAGHSTIGQCIDHVKPAVLVPIHNHPEQISNAEKFEKLGLGVMIRSELLTPQNLIESIEKCATDQSYIKSLEVVCAVSKRYRGVEKCAEIIRRMA